MRILLPVIILILLFCISMNIMLSIGFNTVELENSVLAQVVKENIELRRQLYRADRYIKHIIVNKQLNKRLERRYMFIEQEKEL